MSTVGIRIRPWGGRGRRRSLRSVIQRSFLLAACALALCGVFAGFFEIGRATRSVRMALQPSYAPQGLRAKSLSAGIPEAPAAAPPIPAPVPSEAGAAADAGSASAAAAAAASVRPLPAAPSASIAPPRTSSSVPSQELSPARPQAPARASQPPEKPSGASQPSEQPLAASQPAGGKPSAGGGGSFDTSE